jgi:FkbM family methyltransferase
MWDIGANIGCYCMYPASRKEINVCAFEPSPSNYWLLASNIALNDFEDRLVAYPFALSNNKSVVDWSPNISPGSADHQLLRVGDGEGRVTSLLNR